MTCAAGNAFRAAGRRLPDSMLEEVAAVVAVHGASVPWGVLQADGVTIVPARRVPDLLQALPPILGPERVTWLADRTRLRFHPAA